MWNQPNISSAKRSSYLGKQGLEDFAHISLPDQHQHRHSRRRMRSTISNYGDVTVPVLKPGISISFFCLYPYLSKCSIVLKSVLVTLSALIRNCFMTRRGNRLNWVSEDENSWWRKSDILSSSHQKMWNYRRRSDLSCVLPYANHDTTSERPFAGLSVS